VENVPSRQDSAENGDVTYSAEVVSETESLLKRQKSKSKTKKIISAESK
jgi:hypothetical protein